jgi:hypothetical protein
VDPSENEIQQIDFEHATDAIIIFHFVSGVRKPVNISRSDWVIKKEIGYYSALWKIGILIVDISLETNQPFVKHVFKHGLGKAVKFLSYYLKQII